ncbi:MAG: NADH-quinone oxidoreductase subunit C [Flavobacteriales bacterium]
MESNSENTRVLEALKTRFPQSIKDSGEPYGMLTISVDTPAIKNIIAFLKDDEGFSYLTDLCGMHYDSTDELGVVYHIKNLYTNTIVRIKTRMPKNKPEIDSMTSLFNSANWQERETYDFFGIIFKGHPDLRRILNMDEMDYFPLRKEYALEDSTRTDKNDTLFGR